MGIYSDIYKMRIKPGSLIAAVFFGLFVVAVILLVGWFALSAPIRTELHVQDGKSYICRYYPDEIECELYEDSHIGGGRAIP